MPRVHEGCGDDAASGRGPFRSCCGGIVDSLALAKEQFPGKRNNLDALCERLMVPNAHRKVHGALLDAELLAEIYLWLMGGRQPDLGLLAQAAGGVVVQVRERIARPARPHAPSPAELAAHEAFLAQLSNPIWHS